MTARRLYRPSPCCIIKRSASSILSQVAVLFVLNQAETSHFVLQLPSHVPPHFKSRFAALRPGGPASTRFFGTNPTVLQVGSTVFVHGGLLPGHVDYGLDRISET